MKFKLFNREYELTGADFFKAIAFILFTITSMYFSINMWFSLGQDRIEKLALTLLSVAIDSLKTYAIITANGFLALYKDTLTYYGFSSLAQHRKEWKDLKLPWVGTVLDKKKRHRAYLAVYVLAAATSIMAITGFGLVTVDRYNRVHTTQVISTDRESFLLSEDIEGCKADIAANDESIKAAQASITEVRVEIVALDPEIKGYAWYREQYQKKIDKYNKEIEKYRDESTKLREEIKTINVKLRELAKQNGTEIVSDETKKSSMFELIAKALGIKNPTTVMLVMMVIAAFVNELGIVATSPQFKQMIQMMIKDKVEAPELPQKTYKRKEVKERKNKNVHVIEGIQERSVPIEVEEEPQSREVTSTTETQESTLVSESQRQRDDRVSGEKEELKDSLLEKATVQDMQNSMDPVETTPPRETIHSVSVDSAEYPIPVEPVERPIQSVQEKFIHALFSNSTKPYLKEKREAAAEAGMNLIEASALFDKLAKLRGNKGWPLIEFRNSQWYPNFTSEVIIAYLVKLNLIAK